MGAVRISTARDEIPGYLAVPSEEVAGPGPWPGVVVVHDAFGLGDDVRAIAGRFATAGYVALVPDLYARGGAVRCIRTVMRELGEGSGQSFDDVDAARQALLGRSDCTGRVGVAGFCMGGGFAILGASRGFDASAPYYGYVPQDTSFLDGACPVVASFGAKDRTLRGVPQRLESALTEHAVPHDVKEYPDAGHSFANRLRLGPFNVLGQVLGLGYHHESSEDAWDRVLTFFGEHLR